MRTAAIVYLIVVAIMSLLAFVAYGIDKRRATTGSRRLSERSLHLMALAGGWPGALVAQRMFRHKTQKLGFRIVFWGLVLLHLSLVGGAAYLIGWQLKP